MKAVVAAFNQEKALVGAFSVIKNLRMQLFEALEETFLVGKVKECMKNFQWSSPGPDWAPLPPLLPLVLGMGSGSAGVVKASQSHSLLPIRWNTYSLPFISQSIPQNVTLV